LWILLPTPFVSDLDERVDCKDEQHFRTPKSQWNLYKTEQILLMLINTEYLVELICHESLD
uniref:Leptin receptor n=1 Tax=Gongylonema pulchrum TaxID=637853 RepID=A0A183DHL3_9BILA